MKAFKVLALAAFAALGTFTLPGQAADRYQENFTWRCEQLTSLERIVCLEQVRYRTRDRAH